MRLALRLYLARVLTNGAGDRGYIALGLYSALVLIKEAWERGKPWVCTLYWCSPGEPGNKTSNESILVLIRGAWEQI